MIDHNRWAAFLRELEELRRISIEDAVALGAARNGLLTLKEWCGPHGAGMQIGAVEAAVDEALKAIEKTLKSPQAPPQT